MTSAYRNSVDPKETLNADGEALKLLLALDTDGTTAEGKRGGDGGKGLPRDLANLHMGNLDQTADIVQPSATTPSAEVNRRAPIEAVAEETTTQPPVNHVDHGAAPAQQATTMRTPSVEATISGIIDHDLRSGRLGEIGVRTDTVEAIVRERPGDDAKDGTLVDIQAVAGSISSSNAPERGEASDASPTPVPDLVDQPGPDIVGQPDIVDQNRGPTDISIDQQAQGKGVIENAADGTVVATVTVIDPDGDRLI